MPLDPELVAETKAWFAKANSDLRSAEVLQRAVPPLFCDAVFHCQQAAEKARKGFLTWHNRPFRKTHNLEEIGEQCLALDETLKNLIDLVTPMTEYAWTFRYPGEAEEPTSGEVEEALTAAREVYRAVLDRLPSEVRPEEASPRESA